MQVGNERDKQAKPSTEIKMSVLVDKDLARAFKAIAKANNRNQSILLRDFMQEYVKKNGQLEIKF